ncbi:hypothetical protein GGS24DRAFT_448869 [Hypoxylon argillaceum]|nr:hypothetical protein GGS24DRAFT_448869 [Hypoxylon argillaceum]
MKPLNKKLKRDGDPCGDAGQSTEALQPHHNASQSSIKFSGDGIGNAGSIVAHRDIYIKNTVTEDHKRKPEEEKRKQLLESLRFDQIDDRKLNIRKAHRSTCGWFLKTQPYTDWAQKNTLRTDCNFLWIIGKPGAGKSTLMKFLLGTLEKQIKGAREKHILLSFFFNARGSELEKTTTGLYRSLLLQLLAAQPKLQRVLDDIGIEHSWTVESLKGLFEKTVENFRDEFADTSLICLIDALDECEEAQIRDMVDFLHELRLMDSRIRICFASRHYPNVPIKTRLRIVLEEQTGHAQDITDYLNNALELNGSAIAEDIRKYIRERACGVFMWVRLVVGIVNKLFDAGKEDVYLEQIQKLPEDLDALFVNILTHDNENREELLVCIQWVLFAQQPLTPKQLYFAIHSGHRPHDLPRYHSRDNLVDNKSTEDKMRKYILSTSKGLAEPTKSKRPTIQFIHESVRDFFLQNHGFSKIWPDLWPAIQPDLVKNFIGHSHDRLKQCCENYVSLGKVEDFTHKKRTEDNNYKLSKEDLTPQFPFLEYAIDGMLYHADQAASHGIDQKSFLTMFPRSNWIKYHNVFERYEKRRYKVEPSLLYILCATGMPALIRALPGCPSCFMKEYTAQGDSHERYIAPIFAAIATNKREVMIAALTTETWKYREDDPNLSSCVKAMFKAEIPDVPVRAFSVNDTGSILGQLMKFGNEKVVLCFLCTNLWRRVLREEEAAKRELLIPAIEKGFHLLVEELLKGKIANPSESDAKGRTPLSVACSKGDINAVKLLLDRGVKLNEANKEGQTPLDLALSSGHIGVVNLLVNNGASANQLMNLAERTKSDEGGSRSRALKRPQSD